jgi:hypothetical protein
LLKTRNADPEGLLQLKSDPAKLAKKAPGMVKEAFSSGH